jgi:hypothetical protein
MECDDWHATRPGLRASVNACDRARSAASSATSRSVSALICSRRVLTPSVVSAQFASAVLDDAEAVAALREVAPISPAADARDDSALASSPTAAPSVSAVEFFHSYGRACARGHTTLLYHAR